MATSKHSKKRPLSLSLSQSTGMESSKIKRKKNVSSQHCDIPDSISRSLPMVREVEDNPNPKRKFVEEWLESSNPDPDIDVERADENDKIEAKDEENVVIIQVKEAIVCDNFARGEVIESSTIKKENVREEEMEIEAGTSSEHVAEDEPLLQCPLCWKNFEKPHTKSAHLKACASANGLTTRQLIEAVDLHKKQLAERRKLGLFPTVTRLLPPPAATKRTAPKKAEGSTSRNRRSSKNSELELALALSLSLAKQEERQESLNAFGFTSKSNGTKKPSPVLLTRTQAERERLITEKVSIVLLEEPGETQQTESSQEVHPVVQSAQLQEWRDENHPLWKKSYVSPSKNDVASYYVSALGHVIEPSKTEVGSNLRHISQLPGRLNTPKKSEKPEEKAVDDSSVSECRSTDNTLSLSKLEQDVKAKHLSDWASMLKNSCMSDVSIYVLGGMAIPAHKLVLTVRCPQVLQDVTKQQNHVTGLHVDVILWPDISSAAALCFLEYLYFGSIRSIHTLRKGMSELRWLASRYEANDLSDVLSYLESRKRAKKSTSDEDSLRSATPEPAPLALSGRESLRSRETVPIVHNVTENESDDDVFREVTQKKEVTEHSIHSQKTALCEEKSKSPDLFSEEYKFALSPSPKSKASQENTVARKLSFDTPLKTQNESSSIRSAERADGSSVCVSPRKEIMLSSPASPRLAPNGVFSFKMHHSAQAESKLANLSPFSDVPECDTRLEEPETDSQRRSLAAFDDDVMILSGDEQPETDSRRRSFASVDDDIVILSGDDEPEKDTLTESHERQDIFSISPGSAKSPSADKKSPYISPVWDGFDDMPCDIGMGSNWNDEAVSGGGSPIRERTPEASPRHVLDKMYVPSIRGTSPVGGRCGGTSPYRAKTVHDVSDSASASSEDGPTPADVGGNLLDDSMNAILASSFLDRLEKDHQTPRRSTNKNDGSSTKSSRVTPPKNYCKMTSPELKTELEKFGLKPSLGRRKGIKMLEHIYNVLHPWVPVDEGVSLSQTTTREPSSSQPYSRTADVPKSGSSSSSSSSGSSAGGLSDVECDDSDSGTAVSQQGAKRLSASELEDVFSEHIKKDKVLHRKILEYEAIFIEHLYAEIKSQGYKFKISDLMAFLGRRCINYRSVKVRSKRVKKNGQNGNQRKKRPPDLDLDSPDSSAGF